jgi:prepilin-type N-terminal cleavage/methylation domain-containing protein
LVSRAERGYTLLEVVFSIAIFGIFLFTLTALMTEMRGNEQRYPINYMKHPQVIALISRMRKDVLDAFGPSPYPAIFVEKTRTPEGLMVEKEYRQSSKTLIVESVQTTGFVQIVVWDFSTPGEARRKAFNVGKLSTNWVALGVPAEFSVTTFEIENRPYSVRLKGIDKRGKLAIDQIFQPRAHE